MKFSDALELLKQGWDIKRRHWSGFWSFENNTIMMHCKDGRNLDIREAEDMLYTVSNMAADDWEIATVVTSPLKDGEIIDTFGFGEAIRLLKLGYRVCRKGWNGKGIFIELQVPDAHSKMTHPYIFIDTTGLQTTNPDAPRDRVPWLASQTDMLATDWINFKSKNI